MLDLSPAKIISDPVHGIIELTALEADIVSTKAFQRLHNVHQLGLAHYVFPAANYSRFSHSIGACHNAQKILAAIQKNNKKFVLSKKRIQTIRLAALVHDLGHYPFSHAFEHEISEFYTESTFLNNSSESQVGEHVLDHEEMGAEVLKSDPEIQHILGKHRFTCEEITNAFKKPDESLAGILSSDLDCDRLDYLRRTAHHSGLPYGNVDISYIMDQATIDSDGRYCFGSKALRAADHLLVSRYFDYLQVPYHKSVVALEWSLKVVIRTLLNKGKFVCSAREMRAKIANNEWHHFDDGGLLALARELKRALEKQIHRSQEEDGICAHINAILHRKPAKVIASKEAVCPATTALPLNIGDIEKIVGAFQRKHKLCELALKIWQPKDFSLIKASSKGAYQSNDITPDEPEYYEYARIKSSNGECLPIHQYSHALMNQIHDFRYKAVRVYALSNGNAKFEELLNVELIPQLISIGMDV